VLGWFVGAWTQFVCNAVGRCEGGVNTYQHNIAAQLVDLHEECERLVSICERKLSALEELKKSLLHQAFSGQL
jgi:hypothetical protein